jgi:allantoin racemase
MSSEPSPLLVLNPNRSGEMTSRVLAQLRQRVPGVEWRGATAVRGPAVIDSQTSFAAGAQAAAPLLRAELRARPDTAGVLLACFGDPGLEALRDIAAPRPVWGLAEAALRHCSAQHGPCAVLTSGPAWVPLLKQRAADFGLADVLVGVWALPVNGAALAAEPARWLPTLQQLGDEAVAAGAKAVLLGGAAFSGLGLDLKLSLAVPVIDGLDAAAALITRAVRPAR